MARTCGVMPAFRHIDRTPFVRAMTDRDEDT
jgi:hypothetical protein